MKSLKYIILFIAFPLLSYTTMHKYYVSVTKVEYVKEKQSVQIITRVFIDDLEKLLRERYDESVTLQKSDDEKQIDAYIEEYVKTKLKISINGEAVDYNFLGKEYDEDVVQCYMEIEKISQISSFEITNKILFDVFDEQKNIVRTHINSRHKSFILIPENDKGMLNF